jgi:hypothetical protein
MTLTAAITAVATFLSTPAGQQLTLALIAADKQFVTIVGDVIIWLHGKLPKA